MSIDIKDLINDQLRETENITEASIHVLEEDIGQRFRVEIIEGADMGKIHYLEMSKTTIGRGPTAIALKDIDVSRLHACFEVQDTGQVLVRDLGSTNGTHVNGVRVAEMALKTYDKIMVGTTVMQLVIEKVQQSE